MNMNLQDTAESTENPLEMDSSFDQEMNHPFFDRNYDEIEAFEAKEDIESRLVQKSAKSPKKYLKKEKPKNPSSAKSQ